MSILSSAYSWVNLKFLLAGLGVTLEVSVISIVLSFVIGLILVAERRQGSKMTDTSKALTLEGAGIRVIHLF